MIWKRLGVAAVIVFVGCDLVRPSNPLALDPNAVLIETVLFAGARDVYALTGFPHRDYGGAPQVTLELHRAGEVASFEPIDSLAPCGAVPRASIGIYSCLHARLADSLQAGDSYRLVGAGPQGEIRADAKLPSAPVLVSPSSDTTLARNVTGGAIAVTTLKLSTPPDIRRLALSVRDVRVLLSSGELRKDCALIVDPFPAALLPPADTVTVLLRALSCPGSSGQWRELQVSLQVWGFDSAYSEFALAAGDGILRTPLPNFGLSGAFGVVGSASGSRVFVVVVR